MLPGSTQGLITKHTLTQSEQTDIEHLTSLCNTYEGLHMRAISEIISQRSGQEINDFLYYDNGTLIGYLALDNYGFEEKELVGMVHPNYRHRGIFRTLLNAAKEEFKHRGGHRLVLTCERSSASGQACVKAIGAHLDYSEHEMVLGTFQERPLFDERLRMRQANIDDLEVIASILDIDMGNDKESAKRFVAQLMQQHKQHFYLATLNNETLEPNEPVGTIRLDNMQHQIGIYGFIVRPQYRGRGYGRQILQEAIHIIRKESLKDIMLDVDTNNTNALGLYLSCGFEIKTTYDYYDVNVA